MLIRDAAHVTDKGPYRRRNEDFALGYRGRGIFVVADGLGGAVAGDRASRVAAETAATMLHRPEAIDELVEDATTRQAVIEMSHGDGMPGGPADRVRRALLTAHCRVLAVARETGSVGMATAMVVAWRQDDRRWWIGHVGDCRAYVMDGQGELCRLTTDHSLSAVLSGRRTAPAGLERSPYLQSRLTQVVGGEQVPLPDVRPWRPASGGRLMLCSDGVWNSLQESDLAAVLRRDEDAETICSTLVHRAVNGGSRDNLTVLVVSF